jgi:hypothetical protein
VTCRENGYGLVAQHYRNILQIITSDNVHFQYGGGTVYFAPDVKFLGKTDFEVTNIEASNTVKLMLTLGVLGKRSEEIIKLTPHN